ncbi:hypothetical protein MFU01_71240 [Myxococcus fulvus]|uniref:Uncharacterized protein n=1 Tax=Myxococcus fulvus TaxID=33 RepID=A0A511TD48_MYXFU|nr:hypothetical protein MFUL124B02_13045 [Myxococcus fulvus 124B02]GEN12087.1 hypothetical protein MFU01_71240 [Myxococcus fulvus]
MTILVDDDAFQKDSGGGALRTAVVGDHGLFRCHQRFVETWHGRRLANRGHGALGGGTIEGQQRPSRAQDEHSQNDCHHG